MGTVVARSAEADQVVEAVGVRADSACKMVHVGHCGHRAVFAHAVATLPHLFATFGVDRVPFASPFGYGSYRRAFHSSSANASFSSSTVALRQLETSRAERRIPPTRSSCTSVLRM